MQKNSVAPLPAAGTGGDGGYSPGKSGSSGADGLRAGFKFIVI
jgi:hypothetical protein